MNTATIDLSRYPTITQTQAHEGVGSRYEMVPTSTMLDILADHGWLPSKVLEGGSRKYKGFQKHIVRLRNENQLPVVVGDYIPELVLFNSHMGSAAFKMLAGIFRLVCSNGMVTGESFNSATVRHTGFAVDKAEAAIRLITSEMPQTMEAVERFRSVKLIESERIAFAESAIELIKDKEDKFAINPRSLILPRRYADQKDESLWSTLNVVQENVIRGGVRRIDADGRRTHTRAVKDVSKNIDLNRALWTLAERMQTIKSAH